MKQVSKEKYQIAWFKLSEFIKRNEKERALGIYKLLMHSIDDQAFAKQLEGDLLLFFDEADAINSYINAANIYKKNGKLAQATAIYEHLVILVPESADFINQLTKLYGMLNHPTRITLSMNRLIDPIIQAKKINSLESSFEEIMPLLNSEEKAILYETATLAMLKYDRENEEYIIPLIEKTIKTLKTSNKKVKNFINKIGTLDKDYQQEAIQIIKKVI